MINDKNKTERLDSENKREGARLGVTLAKNNSDVEIQSKKMQNQAITEGTKIAMDVAKELTNE